MRKYKSCLIALLAVVGSLVTGAASAQNFPNKPITMILSSGSGSSVDIMARTLAKVAEKELGQPVVVSNKPGGDGATAMAELLSNRADGYTLWAATKTFPVALNTNLKQFKAADFQPLVMVQVDPFALVVQSNAKWKNLNEFLADAKAKRMNVGGFGTSSPHGLFNYFLAKNSGAKLNWIPHDAGSKALTALMGGHLDAVVSNPSSMMSQVKAGTLRILAVATPERLKDLPNVPTFKEQGYDMVDSQWRGFFVKAGTPAPVVAKLDAALKRAIESKEFQDYLVKTVQYSGYMGPKEFSAYVKKEIDQIAPIADDFLKSIQ